MKIKRLFILAMAIWLLTACAPSSLAKMYDDTKGGFDSFPLLSYIAESKGSFVEKGPYGPIYLFTKSNFTVSDDSISLVVELKTRKDGIMPGYGSCPPDSLQLNDWVLGNSNENWYFDSNNNGLWEPYLDPSGNHLEGAYFDPAVYVCVATTKSMAISTIPVLPTLGPTYTPVPVTPTSTPIPDDPPLLLSQGETLNLFDRETGNNLVLYIVKVDDGGGHPEIDIQSTWECGRTNLGGQSCPDGRFNSTHYPEGISWYEPGIQIGPSWWIYWTVEGDQVTVNYRSPLTKSTP